MEVLERAADGEPAEIDIQPGLVEVLVVEIEELRIVGAHLPGSAAAPSEAPIVSLVGIGEIDRRVAVGIGIRIERIIDEALGQHADMRADAVAMLFRIRIGRVGRRQLEAVEQRREIDDLLRVTPSSTPEQALFATAPSGGPRSANWRPTGWARRPRSWRCRRAAARRNWPAPSSDRCGPRRSRRRTRSRLRRSGRRCRPRPPVHPRADLEAVVQHRAADEMDLSIAEHAVFGLVVARLLEGVVRPRLSSSAPPCRRCGRSGRPRAGSGIRPRLAPSRRGWRRSGRWCPAKPVSRGDPPGCGKRPSSAPPQ